MPVQAGYKGKQEKKERARLHHENMRRLKLQGFTDWAMRIDDIFVRYLMQYEILLGQVTKEHTQKEVTDYIKKCIIRPIKIDR